MGSILIDPQKVLLRHHFFLQDLQIHQLEDPGDLRSLILDIKELGIIIQGGFFPENKLPDLQGQIADAHRIFTAKSE